MSQLIQTPTYYLADAKRAAWGDWAHDDRQSRNGAGKTSFVELVHFLFGADVRKESIFRSEVLTEWTFDVAVDVAGEAIFKHLQDYAGMNGEPKRQGAALAVLAYFFDSCDIFEDPLVSVEAS